MDLLRKVTLIVPLVLISSCAKLSYLYEQGRGQLSLLTSARENKDVLHDIKIPIKYKDKIVKVEEYKKYFYRYWDRPPQEIYSQTTILDRDAVTYLLIASPYNKIDPNKFCFPFMGCFPYIGFFKEKSAREKASELSDKGLITWVRPVYAYSTLGYFDDPIISSFFRYNDFQLAELVFHELFHRYPRVS